MSTPSPQSIERVLIVGAGRMGIEIAAKSAAAGLDVRLYDRDDTALSKVEQHISTWRLDERGEVEVERLASAARQLTLSPSISVAADGCDLLIEAVNEDLALKRNVLAAFAEAAPDSAIFATNTSSLVPSQLAHASGRPDRFAAMHFLYSESLVEIMGHHRTAPTTLAALRQFCSSIGHRPIDCLREIPGYISNSLLFPVAQAAMQLLAMKAASFEDIDRCFMISYKASHGPFGYLDFVGLDTTLDVLNTQLRRGPDRALSSLVDVVQPLVDQGRVGARVGAGFYSYPNPAYSQSGFLSPTGEPQVATTSVDARLASRCEASINLAEWGAFRGCEKPYVGCSIARFKLDPANVSFLTDHRYRGKPILPAAAVVAIAKVAVEHAWPRHCCGVLTDVQIEDGMRFFVDRSEEMIVEMVSTPTKKSIECRFTYPFRNRAGKLMNPARPIASLTAWLQEADLPKSCGRTTEANAFAIDYSEESRSMRYGTSMRRLKSIACDESEAFGEIKPHAICETGTPQAVIDNAVAVIDAMLLSCTAAVHATSENRLLIPEKISVVRFGNILDLLRSDICVNRTVHGGESGIVADCGVFGQNGHQLIAVEGYRATDVRFDDLPFELRRLSQSNSDGGSTPWRCFAQCRGEADVNIVDFDLDPAFGFITDHRFRGTPLLPLASILQLMRYAVEQTEDAPAAWNVRDLNVENGLKFFTEDVERVSVEVSRRDTDLLCELRHHFKNRRGDILQPRRLLASALLTASTSKPVVEVDGECEGDRFTVRQHDDPDRLFYIGPSMRALNEVCFAPESGSGVIDVQRTAEGLHDAERGVAVIDAGLCACNAHTQRRFECGLQIPQRASHVVLGRHARPHELCRVAFRVKSASDTRTKTDLVIVGEDGDCIARFEDYECAVMQSTDGPLTILNEAVAALA